jgi:hypothetical protein
VVVVVVLVLVVLAVLVAAPPASPLLLGVPSTHGLAPRLLLWQRLRRLRPPPRALVVGSMQVRISSSARAAVAAEGMSTASVVLAALVGVEVVRGACRRVCRVCCCGLLLHWSRGYV